VNESRQAPDPLARHGPCRNPLDAEICKTVLHEMTVRRCHVCPPVFDSFIVREEDRDTLVRVMNEAFEKGLATVRRNPGGARIIRPKGPHMARVRERVPGSGAALPAAPSARASHDRSDHGSGAGDTLDSFTFLSDERDWATVEMDIQSGPRNEDEIKHDEDMAMNTQEGGMPRRMQAQEITPVPEGLEIATPETPISGGVLKVDPSPAPVEARADPKGLASGRPTEGLQRQTRSRTSSPPSRVVGMAQTAAQEASAASSAPAPHHPHPWQRMLSVCARHPGRIEPEAKSGENGRNLWLRHAGWVLKDSFGV
jgi:hypothetical protein